MAASSGPRPGATWCRPTSPPARRARPPRGPGPGCHDSPEKVRMHALVGYSQAEHDNPIQTTLLFDALDVDGYSFDYRGNSRLPVISYGNARVRNPATWRLSQIRLRPQSSVNEFRTASFDFEWNVADALTLKAGPQWKKF